MSVRLRFQPSGKTITAPEGSILLDSVRRAGLPLASACGADGLCGRCGVRVLAGAETLLPETESERNSKARNRIDPVLRLACKVQLRGDLEITTSYW